MSPMNQDIFHLLLLAACFLGLFGLGELLYHQMGWRTEITRKLVHIGTGFLTLLFPVLLSNHWQVLILCASFLVILLVSLRFKWLPSINAIGRVSHGSILYPVAVYGCYLLYTFSGKGLIMFYLPMMALALCDPIAAFIGKRYPIGAYRIGSASKTASGSFAFFLSCILIAAISFYFHEPSGYTLGGILPYLFLISLVATVSESISGKGSDNISIPASVAITLQLII